MQAHRGAHPATLSPSEQLCGLLFEAAEAELARGGGSAGGRSSSSSSGIPSTPPQLPPAAGTVLWERYDSSIAAARHLLSLDGFAPPALEGEASNRSSGSSGSPASHATGWPRLGGHPWAAAAVAFAPAAAGAAAAAHTLSAVLAVVPVWRTSPLSAAQVGGTSGPGVPPTFCMQHGPLSPRRHSWTPHPCPSLVRRRRA